MVKSVLLALVVVTALAGSRSPAARAATRCPDCACPDSASATLALHTSAVVFIGTASRAVPADSDAERGALPGTETVFSVDFLWKGDSLARSTSSPPRLRIWTPGGSCAVAFVPGELYLVYAWRDERGRLVTGRCARTRPLADPQARADVDELYRVTRPPRDAYPGRVSLRAIAPRVGD